MPASYTIRRSVPRNTRRSKPASTPSTCFPSFSINLFMAFPLPRGDLSSNTTNIIREQKTPSPFGCGYAALCQLDRASLSLPSDPAGRPLDFPGAFDCCRFGRLGDLGESQLVQEDADPRSASVALRSILATPASGS